MQGITALRVRHGFEHGPGQRQPLLACVGAKTAGNGPHGLRRFIHRRKTPALAQVLTDALDGLTGLAPIPAMTNIVVVDTVLGSGQWVDALEKVGVRCFAFGPNRIRLVFHKDVDDAGLEQAISQFRKLAISFA